MSGGPCMCGACDCPSCGPAQGYTVVRVWDHNLGRYVHRNPEDDETHGDSAHGREYRATLALIDAHAAEWTPAAETAAAPAPEQEAQS